MRRRQQEALKGVYIRFWRPKVSIAHKRKFGFQSVLANTWEWLDMLQGLSSTNLSNRLPSYFVAFQQSSTRKVMTAIPELDRSIDRSFRFFGFSLS
jgi:hypothetical protein